MGSHWFTDGGDLSVVDAGRSAASTMDPVGLSY